MKTINLFEVGDEVMVKAVITAVTIEQGEIKYQIKNDITGRNYEHLFESEQLYSIPRQERQEALKYVKEEKNGREQGNREQRR